MIAALLLVGLTNPSTNLNPVVQSAIVSLAAFLVLPLLYCKMILKRPWTELGFQRGSLFAGIGGSLIAISAGLVFLFGLMHFTPLFEGARLPVSVEKNFFVFLLYEVVLNGWIALLLEVFFRGFVMLLWLRRLGFLSVFVQAALFAGLVYETNSFSTQMIPLLLFSPLAGLIAYQSRSILASWAASWFFLFLVDALLLIVP